MGDENTLLTEVEVRHLLRRAGFEVRSREVKRFTGKSRGKAVAGLVRGNGTSHKLDVPYPIEDHDLRREFHDRWLLLMLRTRKQFQEKLVLFWHDHFATNNDVVRNLELMAVQNQRLRLHCKGNGKGTSFKDFVKAMTRDAAMMEFQDTVRNSKDSPNENFARELQELFTLGPTDLNGVANYSQADIVQIAKALTGWRYRTAAEPGYALGDAYLDAAEHDFGSPKTIYATVGNFGPGGRDITAAGTGEAEIDQVVDVIFEHRDTDGKHTVARFIAGKLLAYLAGPETPTAVVDEVILRSNFDGAADPSSAWQLAPLLREILVHDHFYASAGQPRSVKWPIDYIVTTLRTLKIKPATSTITKQVTINGVDKAIGIARLHVLGDSDSANAIRNRLERMGQILFEPPSVFGWDWETAWANSGTLLERYGFAVAIEAARLELITSGVLSGSSAMAFRPEKLIDLSLTDPGAIVDAVTAALSVQVHFPAPSAQRDALIAYLTNDGTLAPPLPLADPAFRDEKLRGLFSIVLQSPAAHLQ